MTFNINADAVVEFTNKLEKLHRSALPVAIRGTLNKAAFDVKKNTMPQSAKANFMQRQPNFFKANSRVEMAKGFNVRSMKAVVGFTENGLKGGNNFAVRELQQQERGGEIKSRSFIPMDDARGGSATRLVRPGNRISNITKIVNANKVAGKNKRQQFMRAAKIAGKGGFVIGNTTKKILWRIDDIRIGRGTTIRKKAIYSYEESREVSIKGTSFMREASTASARKMDAYFNDEAKKQIIRLMK